MKTLNAYMSEYKNQMEKGDIQKAYRGLMDYIMDLRTCFINKYPQYVASGIYSGYMDMTYFSFSPQALREKKLKIAVVFLHKTVRFEVWLAASNKQTQDKYRRIFKDNPRNKYPVSPGGKGVDFIIAATLADSPDFDNPGALTDKIENALLNFISAVQKVLVCDA